MRVVFAPDSFKGSVDAARAARALGEGWRAVRATDDIVLRPMADGGEGTLAAFAAATEGAVVVPVRVTGPDDEVRTANWLWLPESDSAPAGVGVVELASTSGIELLVDGLRPFDAHTLGFGQAIADALDRGVSALVLAIGSSSSTDGGLGLLTALGARFVDRNGHPVSLGARGIPEVARVDLGSLRPLPSGGVRVITDVTNPLVGPSGAANVFGPQKGLSAAEAVLLDADLKEFARLLPGDPAEPGTGAAGGVGFALRAWGACLLPGAAEVSELLGLPAEIAAADLVVTGEGSFDSQSESGKAPTLVSALASEAGIPAALVAGRVEANADSSAFAIVRALSDLAGSGAAAIREPEYWLRQAGESIAVAVSRSESSGANAPYLPWAAHGEVTSTPGQ